MAGCRNILSQLDLIVKYYLLANAFNYLPISLKQIVLALGTILPSENVDAYYLAYAVPGSIPLPLQSFAPHLKMDAYYLAHAVQGSNPPPSSAMPCF